MALSDNENEKTKRRTKRKPKNALGNSRYSDKQKVEAATSYLALGNLALVSRVLGIPEITLRVWKASDWWKNLVEEIKMQERIELSARMKRLVEASQTIVAQRLETGDPVFDQKTGKIVYKPVAMKDAHKVAVDLIDRRKDLEKLTVENTTGEKEDDKKLEKLAERFAEMATKSIQKSIDKKRTVEAEFTDFREMNDDAVHDERETRLQEGVRKISREARTDQETLGEDGSTSES